jgi:hypothetical protein
MGRQGVVVTVIQSLTKWAVRMSLSIVVKRHVSGVVGLVIWLFGWFVGCLVVWLVG